MGQCARAKRGPSGAGGLRAGGGDPGGGVQNGAVSHRPAAAVPESNGRHDRRGGGNCRSREVAHCITLIETHARVLGAATPTSELIQTPPSSEEIVLNRSEERR